MCSQRTESKHNRASMTRRYSYLAVATALLAVEVLIATRWHHLPLVRGSLGDVLVTPLLYFAALALRDFERWRLASWVLSVAFLTELAQRLHLADVLGLARGSLARVLVGDTFQWQDVACYLIGATLALGADSLVARLCARGASASR